MKKGSDRASNMILVLALICAAAGLALGATYRGTRDKIKAQQERERMNALRIVLPNVHKEGFREVASPESPFAVDRKYYEAYDASGNLVGYALEGAGSGYSSTIRVTVGVDAKAGTILGIKITFQQETPGLGANCDAVEAEATLWDVLSGKGKKAPSEPRFQAQFRGQNLDSFVKVGNKYQNIDGLTGATITTNAVADAVVTAVREFKEKILKITPIEKE
jgi:electron transport complex protein RnfG